MKTKVLVIPNYFCGEIVNYYAEYYNSEFVCTRSGVAARNGWHVTPCYAERYRKDPFYTAYLTIDSFEALQHDDSCIVEIL